jgi:hypothetical protein
MGMLNYFNEMAERMRSEQTAVDARMDGYDQKYGLGQGQALSFIQNQFQQPQNADFIDSSNLMAQTNSAAGVVNPAAYMLQSSAQPLPSMPSLAMYDPRSNNMVGALEEEELTDNEKLKRAGLKPFPELEMIK